MSQTRSITISKKCHPALKNSFHMGKESLKNCNTSSIFPHQYYCHNFNVTMWIYSTPTLFSMRGSPFLTLIRSHAASLFILWVEWGQGGAQYLATASTKTEHSQFRCPVVGEEPHFLPNSKPSYLYTHWNQQHPACFPYQIIQRPNLIQDTKRKHS